MNSTYGAQANSQEVAKLLRHMWQHTFSGDYSERPTPLCIWGNHGIGKTQLVRDLAREMGVGFRYFSPAQFEEMGDLIGMPKVVEGNKTRFMPPEWVPQEEGPGVLLIDDVNRADDRILRGLMQLLQFYETASWALPVKWHIVLTANPDAGDYSVTPMDEAMLTRMLHVTMVWDLETWIQWAESAGVDHRGIDFVRTHPELIDQHRTTPRTLVQFFRELETVEDLTKDLGLLKLLASGNLEEEAAAGFISFVRTELGMLLAPEKVLETRDFSDLETHVFRLVGGVEKRVDILSVQLHRLARYVKEQQGNLSDQAAQNLKRILLLSAIPNDLRFSFAQQLAAIDAPAVQALLTEPEIGKILLDV